MSGLAAEHKAINLSQGFPDFPIDERLGTLLQEATQGNFNQYAPMTGLPLLREAIAADFKSRYNLAIDPDTEITVTPGATYGIFTAFTAILNPGDEVIVLEPAYDSYIPNIETNGARAITVPLKAPAFTVDWNLVEAAVSPKTRAIIINTPHNPTGAVWSNSDWDHLAQLTRNTDILVLSDEVYEQIVFDKHKHQSILEHPELRERCFALFSFGKVFHNTGWKLGYVIAPPTLTQAFRHIHQYLSFSVNTPGQYAVARYLQLPDKESVADLMQKKRDAFLDLFSPLPFTIHQPAAGSYFQKLGYERISQLGDFDFACWVIWELGVATIPVSSFYASGKDDKLIRFCFAKNETTLQEAASRLSVLKLHNPAFF